MYFNQDFTHCAIIQSRRAAKLFTNYNKKLQLKIVNEVFEEIKIIVEDFTAPHFSAVFHEIEKENDHTYLISQYGS